MTTTIRTARDVRPELDTSHLEALGWAFTHAPTQEAYRRSTGEDVAPLLERYRQWVEENVVGRQICQPTPRISQSLAPLVSQSSVQR